MKFGHNIAVLALVGAAPHTAIAYTPLNNAFDFIGTNFGVPGTNASFEYVIIGGGTAGLAVATRLAQAKHTVAVVEAGGFYEMDNGNLSVTPSTISYWAGSDPDDYNPLVDWGFSTTPQTGLANRPIHYARGKTLGGSSARNYLAYQRGTVDAYAKWATEVGDDSYHFANLLPYFNKAIQFTDANTTLRAPNATVPRPNASSVAGADGPVHVSFSNYANTFSSWVTKSLASLGFPAVNDFISGSLIGRQYAMVTVDPSQETRSSSETAYLRLALEEQLPVVYYKSAMTRQILFSENKTATGVLVQTARKMWELSATKEVILSAGAFQSPQILMVSGIGPESTLSQHNIPVLLNLPGVGQNMWDHVLFGPSYVVDVATHDALIDNATYRGIATEEYLTSQSGQATNPGADFLAWEKLPQPERAALSNSTQAALTAFPPDWPEIEYLFLDAYAGNNSNYITGTPDTGYNYESVTAALVAPLSRGNVTISSADTNDPPIISPNWLTDPADIDLAIAAFKRTRQIMNTAAIKPIIVEEAYPGTDVATDAQILKFIRETAITVFHASATCKMGKASDPMAVVDPDGRVYGVRGLRVVDASAFPFLPPGHPQSTVYALAEKIAARIVSGS